MLGLVGLVGVPERRRVPAFAESWRSLAGLAVGIAAGAWATSIYFERLNAFVEGARAGNDLDVFLRAAGKVLGTASPYAFNADKTFAYPPFLAWLLAPLHALGSSAAGFVWTFLSLAAIALALWLLGLRDWRCYALTPCIPSRGALST